jgi:hypothetical protein
MSKFPIRERSTSSDIRDIIDYYYNDIETALSKSPACAGDLGKATSLLDDYCTIGSFLTDRAAVRAALVPLERELRARAQRTGAGQFSAGGNTVDLPRTAVQAAPYVTRQADNDNANVFFKSHKLLSGALHDAETLYGFNHERMVAGTMIREAIAEEGTLHSTAVAATGSKTYFKPAGRSARDKVALPSGVPTVRGDLAGGLFNMVLLRHGYQFKDVAAGPYHGEYAHRLQWYAIYTASQVTKSINLRNRPLDIFKSMGYQACKADRALVMPNNSRHLYMWELLFDAAESEARAIQISGTLAHSENTFNCPETLTKELMNLNGFNADDEGHLWFLRVLVKARWKKRFDEQDAQQMGLQDSTAKIIDRADRGRVQLMVTDSSAPLSRLVDVKKALVWYLRAPN